MTTPEGEFPLIPATRLFARLEENLSSYLSNGLLDTDQFYPEIKWMISNLGISMMEMDNTVVFAKNYSVELPCDFYLLDSAWLCCNSFCNDVEDRNTQKYFQGKAISVTETTASHLCQDQSCPPPNATGWSVNACNNTGVIDYLEIKEYVFGAECNQQYKWNNPTLLHLNNNKAVGKICIENCKNLFYSSPYEISIHRRKSNYFLSSNLKDPVIYLKYWKYPIDKETGLPMVPDDPFFEKAAEAHLTHWLLVKLWSNGEITDIENKIKYWSEQKTLTMDACRMYMKFPSFNTLTNLARQRRRAWETYEIPLPNNSNRYL